MTKKSPKVKARMLEKIINDLKCGVYSLTFNEESKRRYQENASIKTLNLYLIAPLAS
jgi:hypothetical protein